MRAVVAAVLGSAWLGVGGPGSGQRAPALTLTQGPLKDIRADFAGATWLGGQNTLDDAVEASGLTQVKSSKLEIRKIACLRCRRERSKKTGNLGRKGPVLQIGTYSHCLWCTCLARGLRAHHRLPPSLKHMVDQHSCRSQGHPGFMSWLSPGCFSLRPLAAASHGA